jgi:uncharacterized protein
MICYTSLRVAYQDQQNQPQRAVRVLGALALVLIAGSLSRAEKLEDLKPQGYVNDFAGVLSAGTQARLAALCGEVDQKTKAQIAVVTIHNLEGYSIEDFANRLYQRWGIGPKSDNRGVLILLAVDDHRYRVEVGYGLEPILPDGKVGGFGREIVPALRRNDYDAALLQLTGAVAAVIAEASGVTLNQRPPPLPADSGESNQPAIPFFLLIALAFLLFGGLRFFIPWGLFGLGYRRRGGPWGGWWGGGGPWIGGGWSGGGFGGGGGGGFGGFGGGISGGGGASGSW